MSGLTPPTTLPALGRQDRSILVATSPGSPPGTGRTRQLTGRPACVLSKTHRLSVLRTPWFFSLAVIQPLSLTLAYLVTAALRPRSSLSVFMSVCTAGIRFLGRKRRALHVRASPNPLGAAWRPAEAGQGPRTLNRLGRGHRPRSTSRGALPADGHSLRLSDASGANRPHTRGVQREGLGAGYF